MSREQLVNLFRQNEGKLNDLATKFEDIDKEQKHIIATLELRAHNRVRGHEVDPGNKGGFEW